MTPTIHTSEASDSAIDFVMANLWRRGAQELDILGITFEQATATMNFCREQGYPTMAWMVNEEPVFVIGLIPTGPGIMCSWFLATEAFNRFQRKITLTLWHEMGKTAQALGLKEIEIFSTCVHPKAARWFEALGFSLDIDRHPPGGDENSTRVRTYRFVRRFGEA